MIGHPFIMSPNMAANIVQLNAFHNYKYTDEIVFFTQGMAKVRAITTSLECKIANSGKDFVNMTMSFASCFLFLYLYFKYQPYEETHILPIPCTDIRSSLRAGHSQG